MIIVTGASGRLGGAVVADLLKLLPADRIGVNVRDPRKVADLDRLGVHVRQGDFTDPASLEKAFEGATSVLIVSATSTGDEAVRQHRNAIDAAVAADVKRIVYTSHMGADPTSPFPPMPDHAATEDALRASGTPFTALRNGFYASTVPMLLHEALETGELRVPRDGAVAWTTHADLSGGIARILADDLFDGATPPLTGPEAVDMSRVAEIASHLTGRAIRHVVVEDEEYHQNLLSAGLPATTATMLTGLFAAGRTNDFGPADPALSTLLNRPTTTIEDYLRTALATT